MCECTSQQMCKIAQVWLLLKTFIVGQSGSRTCVCVCAHVRGRQRDCEAELKREKLTVVQSFSSSGSCEDQLIHTTVLLMIVTSSVDQRLWTQSNRPLMSLWVYYTPEHKQSSTHPTLPKGKSCCEGCDSGALMFRLNNNYLCSLRSWSSFQQPVSVYTVWP